MSLAAPGPGGYRGNPAPANALNSLTFTFSGKRFVPIYPSRIAHRRSWSPCWRSLERPNSP